MGSVAVGSRGRFEGAVFDLDGLLIDSEPSWGWAQSVMLAEAGCELTQAMQHESAGQGLPAALALWRTWFPAALLEPAQVKQRLKELALGRFRESGRAKPGVPRILELFRAAGCPMAVASSSTLPFIETALASLRLDGYFNALVSAESEAHGKPHPAVYLTACVRLGCEPSRSIAFEDSLHGLRASKAAGMFSVAVPEAHNLGNPAFAIADLVLPSLADF